MLSSLKKKKAFAILGVATISQLEKRPFYNLFLKGCPLWYAFLCSVLNSPSCCPVFASLDSLLAARLALTLIPSFFYLSSARSLFATLPRLAFFFFFLSILVEFTGILCHTAENSYHLLKFALPSTVVNSLYFSVNPQNNPPWLLLSPCLKENI